MDPTIMNDNVTDTNLITSYPPAEYLDQTKNIPTTNDSIIIRELLGSASLIFWSIQLLPQVIKNYRNGSTSGLSSWMLLLWSIEACLSGAYLIIQKLAMSLVIQFELFLLFSLLCSAQCYYYSRKRSFIKTMAIFIILVILAVAVQTGIIFGIKQVLGENPRLSKGPHRWLLQVLGTTPVMLSIIGFVPQYIEVFRLQGSYGLSKCFLFLDMQGAVFALACLMFHKTFDVLAAANAAVILVLDIGLIIICIIFYHRAPSNYDHKKIANATHSIDREDEMDSNKLSVATVEWWPTAHDLDDDELDRRNEGLVPELGGLRNNMPGKRKCSTSSTHTPPAPTPTQQTITMVTIPLARAHTMDMDCTVPQPRLPSTFPPRPPTPLGVPELLE
ncbi:PQ loop repeat-domain-containing protein [Syncephalis plumigaleata]|nr:PQ loop repeat-domain-containing protein [Syncephalis plumigaleata]